MTASVAGRRAVHLATLDDLAAEVERVVAADARGRLVAAGGWTAGQVLQHLGRVLEFSLDGFPFTVPWPTRLVCTLLKWVSWTWLIRIAFRPGHALPSETLRPDPDVTVPAAADYLLGQLRRVGRGEVMARPSPYEGRITHTQWVAAHLRHAEMHLGFLRYGECA